MQNIKITKLILENFRNFRTQSLNFESNLILFVGKNGSGKTNLLEALTLFGKNPNLRGADFDDMIHLNHDSKVQENSFSTSCEIDNHDYIEKLGINFQKNGKKTQIINGDIVKNNKNNDSKNYLPNFVWLTPQLELLLISGKTSRREFLDRIVCDIDFNHNKRLSSYQKSLRERLLILQKPMNKNQESWLSVVENKISELGTAITLARHEAIDFFNNAIESFESNFPKSKLQIIDNTELVATNYNALKIEQLYQEKLKTNRNHDKEAFKTHFGIHRSDFSAIFLNKNSSANFASTGEQKSIMLSITLARAKISSQYKNQPTILILDEIMSHLDEKKKLNLLEEMRNANLQCFFSATNKNLIPKDFGNQKEIQIHNISP